MHRLLNKNAVLTGSIDCLCLACEVYLVEDEACLHIYKPEHKDSFNLTQYSEKYKNDCIRKVKKIYYCEYCNYVLTTTTKVTFHVEQGVHITNRNKKILERINGDIVYGNAFRITNNAWNGLIEDTCVICNTEFDDEDHHRIEKSHLLKLIQNDAKTEYKESLVYRKLDDNTFHCLICNIVYTNKHLHSHVSDQHHIENYQKSLLLPNGLDNAKTVPIIDKSETFHAVKTDNNEPNLPKDCNPIQEENLKTNHECESKIGTNSQCVDGVPESDNSNANSSKAVDANKETEIKKLCNNQKDDTNKKVDELNTATTLLNKKKTLDEIKKVLGVKDFIFQDLDGKKICFLCELEDFPGHSNNFHHQAILKVQENRLKKKVEKQSQKSNENSNKCSLSNKDGDVIIQKEANSNLKPLDGEKVCNSKENKVDMPEKVVTNNKNKPKPDEFKSKDKPCKIESNETEKACGSKGKKNGKVSDINGTNDSKTNKEELELFTKQNDIDYNASNNNSFCRVCKTKVPASILGIKAHVAGAAHKNKLKNVINKTPMIHLLKSVSLVEVDHREIYFINNEFVIHTNSFHLWVTIELRVLRCLFCEICFDADNTAQHLFSADHMKSLATPLLEIKNEFIREIRPDEFHCGYCNEVYTGFDNLKHHFGSWSHTEPKLGSLLLRDMIKSKVELCEVTEDNFHNLLKSNFRNM